MNDQGSDFTPDELDRLEDALGALGDPAASGELEALPPKLRERLGEYDAILALAREAMPMEDVEPGVLAGILAEARASAPAAPPPTERGPGLWERLRRSFMLPGLALAGTAALLLWVARPDGEPLPRADATDAPIEAAPSPAAAEVKPTEAAPPAPKDMAAEAARQEPADSPSAAAPAAEPADDARREAPAAPASKPRAAGGASAPGKPKRAEEEALPGLDVPEEKRVDADKESVRDQLDRGEAARSKGRCREAEPEYLAVVRSNGPASERARALIGLGLCREADGDTSGAERYYAEAGDLDPTASQWLRNERDTLVKRAAKAKKSKASLDGL